MTSDSQSRDDLMRSDLSQSLRASPLDARKLSSFQRILLTTDGMVTEMLEAYLWERMVVKKLHQGTETLENDHCDLAWHAGQSLLRRTILLCGRTSYRTHIYADSLIIPERLPAPIRDGLLNTDKPIGLLILENKMESFREILTCIKLPAAALATHFDCDPTDNLISRTYRVITGGQPAMLITEQFPETAFRD